METQNNKDILLKNLFEKKRTDYPSLLFSFFAALIFHIAIFCFASKTFANLEDAKESQNNIEIEFEELQKEDFKFPEYAEANPNANSIKPENPAFDSYQDQTAAQEKDADKDSKSPLPKVDGEEEDSRKIVQGDIDVRDTQSAFKTLERPLQDFSKPQNQSNPQASETPPVQQPQTAQQSKSESQNASEQNAQGESQKETSPLLLSDSGAMKVQNAKEEDKTFETQKEESQESDFQQSIKNLPAPQARPKLSMQNPYGLLSKNNVSASNIGSIAIDSRFSEFGAYQQRMFEAICRQWYLLAATVDLSGELNRDVLVEFYLNSSGEITSLKVLRTSSSLTGKNLCTQAILSTAPYGAWTQEMLTSFGTNEEPVRIHFHYR